MASVQVPGFILYNSIIGGGSSVVSGANIIEGNMEDRKRIKEENRKREIWI